jgi:hypothetical protein
MLRLGFFVFQKPSMKTAPEGAILSTGRKVPRKAHSISSTTIRSRTLAPLAKASAA